MVSGCKSHEMVLKDMVFHGTVLGPILKNYFFADIAKFMTSIEFNGERFADDHQMFNDFDKHITNDNIIENLHECQRKVYE